jgi:LPPG:FO 2-phospho-L-lactate transferase
MGAPVVVLAGGTGGAKLARGALDVAGSDLVVVANTGDDIEIYGAYVSPDPDLVMFWLADRIDDRGWGLRDDTWGVMDGLRELGLDIWFNLGDRDLAIGLRRAQRLAQGARPTQALAEIATALGLAARVLPMSDAPVRTSVLARGRWTPFQEFMIRDGAQGPVDGVEFTGIEAAAPPPEVLEAIATAQAIIIGPSNPVISIGPIVAVPGMREALRAARAPVVAISPIVGGQVLKGPTAAFMAWAGQPLNASGVAALYGDLLDAMVCDEEDAQSVPSLRLDTTMADADARARVAEQVLEFARGLA